MNGTEPSWFKLNLNDGGPWESAKIVRGSPVGACRLAVARYSSKLLLRVEVSRSAVIMPKLPRNTHFGLKLYATPMRGWKLLRSFLARAPGAWTIAPFIPVNGSVTVGSN